MRESGGIFRFFQAVGIKNMQDKIIIKGAREHNLKNINLDIPRNKMVVFTGISGSGKSSLAFDTIFAEGQRRYIESLSAYARQFLGRLDKPDVDEIEGLSPAISIDQKHHSANPRSTVATITEIYDYLRVLFARMGKPFCPLCGGEIRRMTSSEIIDSVIELAKENKKAKEIVIMAPVVRGRKGEYYQLLYDFLGHGFTEARIDGGFRSLRERTIMARYKLHTIEIVVDRISARTDFENADNRLRLSEAIISLRKDFAGAKAWFLGVCRGFAPRIQIAACRWSKRTIGLSKGISRSATVVCLSPRIRIKTRVIFCGGLRPRRFRGRFFLLAIMRSRKCARSQKNSVSQPPRKKIPRDSVSLAILILQISCVNICRKKSAMS